MVDYKCPYCGQDSYAKSSKKSGKFPDWKAVRFHLASCKLNTKDYLICDNYGPIAFSVINSFESILHFRQSYPLLNKRDEHFFSDLRQHNKVNLTKISWSESKIIKSIQDFYSANGRIPQHREFDKANATYPSRSTIVKYFGSWNNAIKAAGFNPNTQNGFGTDTYANDGNLYRSSHEAYFVNNFLHGKYSYEYELPYGNGWFYDFYIKELDLYIELDGELRPQRIEEKRKFHLIHGINCLIIKTSEIYNKSFSLDKLRVN